MALGAGWAAAEWVSADPAPIVTIKADHNNGFNTTNFNLGVNFKFTICVADDYRIIGYKIYTPSGWGTTVTTEGGESAVFSDEQTLTVSNLNTTSTWFTTADANLNNPIIDVYIVDAVTVKLEEIDTNGTRQATRTLYSIDGKRMAKATGKGVYIQRTVQPGSHVSETRKILYNEK